MSETRGIRDDWARQLTADQRAELRKLHRVRPAWNLVAVGYWCVWAATGYTMLTLPIEGLWRIPCYLVMAICINALSILMHEAIHGNSFRKPVVDRVFGFLVAYPALMSGYAYKVTHQLHHLYVRTKDDPDDFRNSARSKALQQFVFYLALFVGALLYVFHMPRTAIERGSNRERRFILLEYLLIVGGYTTVIVLASAYGFGDVIVHCWLIPLPFVIAFANVRGWSEHAMTGEGHPLLVTRTVISNSLVSFLMCNLNYHIEHHLFPRVPWYNLPRVHALMRDQYKQSDSYVCKSYLQFIWDGLRTGVHGRTMRRA